jgi:hypothetical protein
MYLDFAYENLNDYCFKNLVAIFTLDLTMYVNCEIDRIKKVRLINRLSSLIEKSKDYPKYYKLEASLLQVVKKYPANTSALFLLGAYYYHKNETYLSINYYAISCKSDDFFNEYTDSKHLYSLLFQKKKYKRLIELSNSNHASYLGNQKPYYLIYRTFALHELQDIESAYIQTELLIRNHYFNKQFISTHENAPILLGGVLSKYLSQKYDLHLIDFLPVSHKKYKTIEAFYNYLMYFSEFYAKNPHFYLLKAKTCEVLGKYPEAKAAAHEGYQIDSSLTLFYQLILIYDSRINGCALR